MSGHSKWATTKYRKGAQDSARAKVFAKIIRQVEVAAREGGSDMTANASLRTMFQKARDASVPIDTIERAVKRGSGELEGVRYEPASYEGYAPAGVVLLPKKLAEDDLMLVVLEAGAEDLADDGDSWRVVCDPQSLGAVRTALEE